MEINVSKGRAFLSSLRPIATAALLLLSARDPG
jgi:hypothetical protein